MSIYPQTSSDYITLVALLLPLFAWAFSLVPRARARGREDELASWRRLQELLDIIYNKDNEHGLWKQLTAIAELARQSLRRQDAKAIAEEALVFWKPQGVHPRLVEALEEATRKLGGQ